MRGISAKIKNFLISIRPKLYDVAGACGTQATIWLYVTYLRHAGDWGMTFLPVQTTERSKYGVTKIMSLRDKNQ